MCLSSDKFLLILQFVFTPASSTNGILPTAAASSLEERAASHQTACMVPDSHHLATGHLHHHRCDPQPVSSSSKRD
ncbi:hypothetical protein INR49_005557, partial [Caranx melampygus]